jgi:LPXTG-motif cell wall-anchored protein
VDPENPVTGDSFMSTFTVLTMLSSLVMLAWLVMNRKKVFEA